MQKDCAATVFTLYNYITSYSYIYICILEEYKLYNWTCNFTRRHVVYTKAYRAYYAHDIQNSTPSLKGNDYPRETL